MANETVLFKRGDSATITSTPVTDGQILFDTSGNGKMYLDNGTDRLEMGGAITVDASLSKTSTNAIQNKAVTGNILNSLAEVSAATQQNTIAGALALKEVNSSLTDLGGFKPVIDESTGKITGYKTTIGGADTVFPFSKGSIKYGGYVKGDLSSINTFKADSPIKSITISNMYASDGVIRHITLISIDEKSIIYDGNDKSYLFDSCISVADDGLTVSVSNDVFTEGKFWPYIACITI